MYNLTKQQQRAVDSFKNKEKGLLVLRAGAGKTLTSLHIAKEKNAKKILVVCPTPVIKGWTDTLDKFFVDLSYQVIENGKEAEVFELSKDVSLITPKLLKKANIPQGLQDAFLIIDEIQQMKDGQQHKHLKLFADNIKNLILLSATPIPNRPKDAYASLRLLQDSSCYLLGAENYTKDEAMKYSFLNRFCFTESIRTKTGRTIRVHKGLTNENLFKRIIQENSYIDLSLPEEVEKINIKEEEIKVQLNEKQREAYDTLWERYFEEKKALGIMDTQKMDAKAIIEQQKQREFVSNIKSQHVGKVNIKKGEKIIIVAWYESSKDILAKIMESKGIHSVVFKNKKSLDNWKEVLIISHEKGGTGTNLQSANKMIIIDRHWNDTAMEQVRGRIFRIGQNADTVEYKIFSVEDSIDDKIEQTNEEKRDQLDKIL